jgi:hypothetical protein
MSTRLTTFAAWLQAIPLKISLDIYERRIRAIFPRLPSIRKPLLSVWTAVLEFFLNPPPDPGLRSQQGGQNTNGSAARLPTLNVDLDAIRAGGS